MGASLLLNWIMVISKISKVPIQVVHESTPGALHKIGGWQVIDWDVFSGNPIQDGLYPNVLSPFHGRSLCIYHKEFGRISIKGGGWTLGPINFHPSPKDKQMYFGLYSLKDGLREWEVNQFLRFHKVHATHVLGLASFNPEGLANPLLFQDGSPVEPSLLFTQSQSPWRVADLVWLSPNELTQVVEEVCTIKAWRSEHFIEHFCQQLASTMAHYHRLGCINDSLSWDNVTLAAEITDFEWFTTPEQALPDGSQFENTDLRRRKEAIYAYEIGCLLSRALKRPEAASIVIKTLQKSYKNGDYATADEFAKLNFSMERKGK